ncbi:MAG: hypothetical protein KDE58_40105 [Caldilineaceae bacterium]|nr:hypothetical protein [Caldilineaceae bacterium]
MNQRYTITNDPIFYVTVVFFALLTTALPSLIGQPTFLLITQTLALFIFLMIALHRQLLRQSLLIVALWLGTQYIVLLLITLWAQERAQLAFPNGFSYGMHYIEWYYNANGALRPDSFAAQPGTRLVELVGITIGSLLTAGLVGVWFLVRAVNFAAFHTGVILLVNENPGAILGALPLWALLRIVGYAGLVVLLAEPLLTSNWNPFFYLQQRRRLAGAAVAFTLLGLLLEAFLPDLWRTFFQ